MSRDHNYTSRYKETSRLIFIGKIHLFLGILARDIANQSYAPNTLSTQALNPLGYDFPRVRKKLELQWG